MCSVSDVLPPRLPAVCMVSGKLNTTWFDLNTPTGQHGKWYEKDSLHLIFTFYLNRDTSVTWLFPVVVLKKKKNISHVDSFTDNESKPSRIVVERSETMLILIHIIADQNSYHDDKSTLQCFTSVFCPQLIRNMRSRRHIDSSSIIAHPVNFYSGEIAKMWCRGLDIFVYILYIYSHPLNNHMDFLYR